MSFNANFRADENLPAISAVLQTHAQAEIVKYTPSKRCTMRVVQNNRNYFAKIYPSKFSRRERGENIHRVGVVLWEKAQAEKLNFRVPKPVRWDASTQTLWQEKLAGLPAIENFKVGGGEKIVFRIGQAIALIARSGIQRLRVFDYTEQMKDSAEFAEKIITLFPLLKYTINTLLAEFNRFKGYVARRTIVPIHGDMHIDQWLIDGDALGLVDFEDFSLGHSERDLAFFMVQLESEYAAEISFAGLNRNLIAGFDSIGGKPDEKLLCVYAGHKWLSKASKTGGQANAEKCLRRAFDCLKT